MLKPADKLDHDIETLLCGQRLVEGEVNFIGLLKGRHHLNRPMAPVCS